MLIAPEISVILSTYNRNHPSHGCQSLFKRAVDSILNQTFFDFELILINDASNDGTHDLCLQYEAQDGRVRYICHEKNTQLPARCYNEGMGLSKGRYIAFMFDDDMWLPTALQDLYHYFEAAIKVTPNLGVVYGYANLIDSSTNKVFYENFGKDWSLRALHDRNLIANNTVLIKREVIEVVGGYDEDPVMKRMCDWDLWQRVVGNYTILCLPKVVANVYFNQPDSIGACCVYDKKLVQKRKRSFRKLPLKTKQRNMSQIYNKFNIFLRIRISIAREKLYQFGHYLLHLKYTYAHKCKLLTKACLQKIGCWKFAKKIYDRIKT